MELAPGLMFDDFLPIPDVESLPLIPFGIKASCVYALLCGTLLMHRLLCCIWLPAEARGPPQPLLGT